LRSTIREPPFIARSQSVRHGFVDKAAFRQPRAGAAVQIGDRLGARALLQAVLKHLAK
jgi:hypothetical protein